MTEKVTAYVTKGDRLLVFEHTHHPEAGIQVPAGSVDPGEPLQEALLREVREETGLEQVEVRAYLGEQEHDLAQYGLSGVERRHFFHLECTGEVAERWRHFEHYPSDGSPGPIEFAFYWVKLPDGVPKLSGNQGGMLSRLEVIRDGDEVGIRAEDHQILGDHS
jgi:8-oxo-dGTP pyrophosphatase MutT (NUDIX family)